MFECPPEASLVAALVPATNGAQDAGKEPADPAELPVAQRMRATYWLKHIYETSTEAPP